MPRDADVEVDLSSFSIPAPAPVAAAPTPSVAAAPAPKPRKPVAPRKPVVPAPAPVVAATPSPITPQMKPVKIDVGAPIAPPKVDIKPAGAVELPSEFQRPAVNVPAPTAPSAEPGAGGATKVAALSGKDELTGKKFADANKAVELWYTRQAQIARDAKRANKKIDPDEVKRQAAVDIYGQVWNPEERINAPRGGLAGMQTLSDVATYLPEVSLNLKGAAMGAVGGALGLPGMAGLGIDVKIPEVTKEAFGKVVGVAPETALKAIEEKEKYVKSISGVNEDPLVRKARAEAERFETYGKRATPPKLVNDFIERYTSYLLVQNGKDALKNTDPLAYEKAKKEADLDAREVALMIRISGDPVFTAGYNVVTTDDVKKTIREKGVVAGVLQAGSVFFPQQVVSRSGETVRTESIPSTVMRDLFVGSAALASSVKLPGSPSVDPLAAIQRGESMLTRALDNDIIRAKMASDEKLERYGAYMTVGAAVAGDMYMPGAEVLAGPAAVKAAKSAGVAADVAYGLVNNMRLADMAGEDVAKSARIWTTRYKAAQEINAISRNPAELVGNLAARNAQEPLSANTVRLALKQRSPGLSYIFETGVASRLDASPEGKAVLDAMKDLGVPDIRTRTLERVQDGEALGALLLDGADKLEPTVVELQAKLAQVAERAAETAKAGDAATADKLTAEARDIQKNITRTKETIDNARAAAQSDIPALIKQAGDEELASMVRRAAIDDEMRALVGGGKLEAPAKVEKPVEAKPLPASRKELTQELAGKSGKSASLTDTARYATILKDIISRDAAAATAVEKLRASGVDHPVDILKGLLKLSEEKPAVNVAALEQALRSSDVDLAAARTDLEMARRALSEPAVGAEEVTQRIERVGQGDVTVPSIVHTGDAPVRQLDGIQRAMREKITDPDILKQVEMRYGKDRSQPFAYGGEPFQRPDRLTEPRQSVNLQGVRDPDHLFKLSRQRAYGNVYTYLSGSDPKGLDNLKQAIEVARTKGGPADLAFVEEAQRYIDTYAKNIDQGTREFAERVGLPHVASRKPFGKWEKQDADAFYAAMEAQAAKKPSAPRARSENAYLRWSAARSAPDGVAPEVIRYDDLVSFSNPRSVKEAGPLNQRVVMPDNSITEKAVVGDWAHGKVVGTTTRDGKPAVLVQPVEYTGAANRYTVTADRPPVSVPVDGLEFRERGRVQELWYGPGKRSETAPYGFVFGREEKSPRPMMVSEWDALVEAEKQSGMDRVTYPRRGNELLYTDMAPPKRPTATDFDTLDIQDELIKRGVPIPKYEGAGALTEAEQRAFEVTTELPRGQKLVARMEQALADAEAALKKIEDQRAPIEAALATRTKESTTAAAVRKALDESLVGDDLTLDLADLDTPEGLAKVMAAEDRPEVSLKRELKEVNKYLAESLRQAATDLPSKLENAFVNTYEYWGMRNSSARVVAERSLGATGKAINQDIREQYAVAVGLVSRTVQKNRKAVSPTDRFTAVLDLVGDQHGYGAAWSRAQQLKGLNRDIVQATALSYFENPEAIVKQAPDLVAQLEETVRTWDKSPVELADELYDMSAKSIDKSDLLVNLAPEGAKLQAAAGDYQFATSIMAQGIVDSTIAQASNVGLAFSAEQAEKMVAAFGVGRPATDAARAEGRRLALLSLETAVDHQRPLTQPYVFGKGSVLTSGAINKPSLIKAANRIGKVDEVEQAATEGEAVVEMLNGVEEMYQGSVYIPDAIKQELDRAVQQLITAARPGAQGTLASTYKQHKIYGLFAPKPTFYWNQVTQESDNIAMALGFNAAVKSGIHSIVPTMFAAPGVSVISGFVDVARGTRGGTTATETMNKVQDVISIAPFGYPTSKAMGASPDAIEGMMGVTYADLNRIGLGRGVQNAPQVADLNRSLEEAFREPFSRFFKQPTARGAYEAGKGALATATVDVTKELGAAITERRRWGTMMMLFEEGVAELRAKGALTKEDILRVADDAAKGSVEIHMDYSATMHPVEKDFLESMFIPFWSFEKSNMIRIARQLGTRGERYLGGISVAREAYRAGRWTRSKRDLVELASFMLDPADDYGFDVEAMQDDDEATAESMRKEGKTEEEVRAAMMYPQYEAIIEQAKANNVEPWQVRNNLSWDPDVRLSMFAPFTDYYNAPVPRSLVPDKYSEMKAVFPIIKADSRIRSVRAYDDMMGKKTSMTMWMLPEDSNLAALQRPIALMNVITSFTANGLSDPASRQRAWGSLFDLTGDPFGFNPIGNALGNALLADQGASKTVTQPVKLDDATGELLMKIMPEGMVTRTNERTKWTMLDEDGGTVEVEADPGYYVSPQTGPLLGMAMISYLDATSQVDRANELGTGLAMLMDDSTKDEGARRVTKALGGTAKKVDVNKLEARASQETRGRFARMPGVMPAAYTEEVQTLAGASLELYQRGQQKLASEEGQAARATTLRNLAGLEKDLVIGTLGTARVMLEELGVLTKEQASSLPNEEIVKAAADPRVRAAAREQGRMDIEAMPDDRAKATIIKNAYRAVSGGFGKPSDYAMMRHILVMQGYSPGEVDNLSGQDIQRMMVATRGEK